MAHSLSRGRPRLAAALSAVLLAALLGACSSAPSPTGTDPSSSGSESEASACGPLVDGTRNDKPQPFLSDDSTKAPSNWGDASVWPAGGCVYENAESSDSLKGVYVVFAGAGGDVVDEISAWASSRGLSDSSANPGTSQSWGANGVIPTVNGIVLDDRTAPIFGLAAGDYVLTVLWSPDDL